MFEQPQELVRRRQVGGVVAADVAAGAQRGQRVDRRRDVQRLVVAAVHQLQQLDGELDVAQSAGAELELAGPHPGGHEFLDAPTHRLHLGDEVLALARRPHHRHQRGHVLRAEFGVARRRAGPSAAPGTPRSWPTARSRRRGIPACGPAAPCLPSGRSAASTSKKASPANRIISPATRVVIASACLADEDDVDVADVVQFARTALAHRDDRQPRRGRVVAAHGPGRDDQRGAERGVGEVGEVRRRPSGTAARVRSPRSGPGRARPAPAAGRGRAAQRELQSVCVRRCFRPLRRSRGAVRRREGSATLPASRCQDCGCATRWSPSASDEPSTPKSRPRSAAVLHQRAVQFVPAVAERVGEPHHRRAARCRRRAHATATTAARRGRRCSSPAGPDRARAGGSTSPSLPTLGSVGRCVAGLATLRRIARYARGRAPRLRRSATATGRPSARTA